MAYPRPEIATAIRQIERWMFASQQDQHPGIALLHANYAVGDLDMLRQMYTDEEIRWSTGKDAIKLLNKATSLQDRAQQRVKRYCPTLKMP